MPACRCRAGTAGIDAAGTSAVMWGVALALVLGKPLGVLLSCWLAVRLRLCALPPGMGWGDTLLAGLLAGIGFTMAIFIATLAFDSEARSMPPSWACCWPRPRPPCWGWAGDGAAPAPCCGRDSPARLNGRRCVHCGA